MKHNTISVILLYLILLLTLTGCVKGELNLNVNDDGSGIYTAKIGVMQQALALASKNGEDPLEKAIQQNGEQDMERWSDGDYEWMGKETKFGSPEELNKIISKTTAFSRFSLKREAGWFKDRFILDARFKLPNQDNNNQTAINPNALIKMQMSVKLPGDIIKTNGATNSAGVMVWKMDASKSTTISAVSEVWNWFNIAIIGIALIGVFLVVVVAAIIILGGVLFYYVNNKRKRQRQEYY